MANALDLAKIEDLRDSSSILAGGRNCYWTWTLISTTLQGLTAGKPIVKIKIIIIVCKMSFPGKQCVLVY